jgi:uncharacterized protein YkwD
MRIVQQIAIALVVVAGALGAEARTITFVRGNERVIIVEVDTRGEPRTNIDWGQVLDQRWPRTRPWADAELVPRNLRRWLAAVRRQYDDLRVPSHAPAEQRQDECADCAHAPQVELPSPPPEASAPQSGPRAAVDTTMTAHEQEVVRLLNGTRIQLGLRPLGVDRRAIRAARKHSEDMCRRNYFDHVSPEGKQPWDRLRALGAKFSAAGENIAAGYPSAATVHQGWLDSPGHRKNRLSSNYGGVGVGVYRCDNNKLYWTEVFVR